MPDFSLELSYDGNVCGLDEVGRGPLAGPVVAACVFIPKDCRTLPFITQIKDSKKLSTKKLEHLYEFITQHCVWGIGALTPQEIDTLNILQASLRAMEIALEKTNQTFTAALVDGIHIPKSLPCQARAVKKGDNVSTSIAAASIIAKVYRDRIMHALADEHPHYGWDTNVGYPSPHHLNAIDQHGITAHHRQSFAPVRNFLEYGTTKKCA